VVMLLILFQEEPGSNSSRAIDHPGFLRGVPKPMTQMSG
jgi:hypothetical protein